jgi:hypothetical protein
LIASCPTTAVRGKAGVVEAGIGFGMKRIFLMEVFSAYQPTHPHNN